MTGADIRFVRGLSDEKSGKNHLSAGRPATPARLHQIRHHRVGRLRLAEGRKLARRAARSCRAERGDPQISRSGKCLHRGPARPYRFLAEEAGCGNARPDQGRRFQRAVAGWSLRLFPQIPRGRATRTIRPHAARRRRRENRAGRRCACKGPRVFQVWRRTSFTRPQTAGLERRHKGLGIFLDPGARLGKLGRSRRPRRRNRWRRGLERGLQELLLRQARR